jgi:hypothetical protein
MPDRDFCPAFLFYIGDYLFSRPQDLLIAQLAKPSKSQRGELKELVMTGVFKYFSTPKTGGGKDTRAGYLNIKGRKFLHSL